MTHKKTVQPGTAGIVRPKRIVGSKEDKEENQGEVLVVVAAVEVV
jgi:hypothetical protein